MEGAAEADDDEGSIAQAVYDEQIPEDSLSDGGARSTQATTTSTVTEHNDNFSPLGESTVSSSSSSVQHNEYSSEEEEKSEDGSISEIEHSSRTYNFDTEFGGGRRVEDDLPPARVHAYLPGTSHPLYPPELLMRRRQQEGLMMSLDSPAIIAETEYEDSKVAMKPSIQHHEKHFQKTNRVELAVLEMPPGAILFPGSTLPLRLRNPDWVRYLGAQIDRSSRIWVGAAPAQETTVSVHECPAVPFESSALSSEYRSYGEVSIGVLPTKRAEGDFEDEEASSDVEDRDNSEGEQENDGDESERRPVGGNRHQRFRCEWMGRVGTVAVITSISRQANNSNAEARGGEHGPHGIRQEIIATALGTCRFRIVAPSGSYEDESQTSRMLRRRHTGLGSMADRHVYLVDKLEEEEPPVPPPSFRLPCYRTNNQIDPALQSLKLVSSAPLVAWRQVWPWRQMRRIRGVVGSSPVWAGLRSNLPLPKAMGPNAFSFWMAANLPLPISDRIDLLESPCAVSRLRLICDAVEKRSKANDDRPICCNQCLARISRMGRIFTVPGAEGAAGNYVNEHGFIHQTITVREVEAGSVVCIGRPQSRDSWFPGYTWTIANCNSCYNHLGWKFLPDPAAPARFGMNDISDSPRSRQRRKLCCRQGRETASSPDENTQDDSLPPAIFWGLTAGAVTEGVGEDRGGGLRYRTDVSYVRQLIVALARGARNVDNEVGHEDALRERGEEADD